MNRVACTSPMCSNTRTPAVSFLVSEDGRVYPRCDGCMRSIVGNLSEYEISAVPYDEGWPLWAVQQVCEE